MNWLVGLAILLVATLLLWAFSALLISMLAGLAVSALLWQPLRWWRRRQLLRKLEQNPALDIQQQAPCALFYLLSAAVVLLGCTAALATLIHLPDSLYSPEQLSLICGLVFAISLASLIKLSGNLVSLGEDAAAANEIRAAWSLAAGVVPMLSLITLIFFVPHTAGWMVWREQWRGYDSTRLLIPLKHNDAEHQQALLQLVRPVLEQGSRILSHRARSRSGGSYTLSAALPARYRFHKDALELQLAGLMLQEQLNMHLQALISVVEGVVSSLPLAYAQCQPSPDWLGRQRFFGRGQQAMQSLRECVRTRQSELTTALPLLLGNLQEVQVGWSRFRPWPALPRWQAAALQEDEDELQQLDTLR
ncbi:hypothetical protein F3J24_22420 [Comamonas sp. Tr-654]|uniref:hypothetical protein n=1 Tax=Comamonas sp. Tr-654 TaxID=2608341 RepID=UPI00141F511D|nr:hypothetical protein [Comamonas sp. Tr-654]NIF86232.1 hypothetical protein [Comamonas sp. Tr-654]